jgi:hypothetical protein
MRRRMRKKKRDHRNTFHLMKCGDSCVSGLKKGYA